MALMQLLEPIVIIVPVMLWLIVIGPLVLYPMARWKANRDPHPDPQLGLKVALHYFRMIAFQLLLVGALIVLWALMRKTSENRGDLYRAGFGLLLPAGLVFGAHVMLLMRTNDHVLVTVRRLFFGYNLLVTGLFGVTALVLAFQALFAKGPSDNEGRFYYAALVVYVCAWAGCAFHYIMMIDRSAAAGPRQNMAPPPPMAAAAGPGLPSLGGGFPPVGQ